jgi:hypothetical protein
VNFSLERRHAVAKTVAGGEDVSVVTRHAYAVIDGATDKTGLRYLSRGREVTAGRFAAETIAEAVETATGTRGPREIIARAGEMLAEARERQHPGLSRSDYPSAAVAVLHDASRQALIVGDCRIAWTEPQQTSEVAGFAPPDEILAGMRALVHAALAANGQRWNGEDEDPGRAAIMPALRVQGFLANRPGPFGYSIVNGEDVPEELTVAVDLTAARRVVLASDGYPRLSVGHGLSLAAAEEHLAGLLTTDPLCVGALRGTKGLRRGQRSFDDRTWLELGAN